LAAELRAIRESRGKSGDAVAAALKWSASKISRYERARTSLRPKEVERLLDYYEITGARRTLLLGLAQDAAQKGWWEEFGDSLTEEYQQFIGLEYEATSMSIWHVDVVTGLLQTEAYARAVIRAVRPGYDEESVERRVAARLTRQKVLLGRASPPGLVVVLNEAVLQRLVGDRYVMTAQLEALQTAARQRQVSLQVLPFSAGAHASLEGGFVLIQFPGEDDPDVVYVEGIMGDLYLESVEEVKRYQSAFERIQAVALSPQETLTFVDKMIRRLG
jgi:transcriptional regulator with XRE-family HTH domain